MAKMQANGQDNMPYLCLLLSQYPIQARIFSHLDTKSILSLSRTSSGLRADIYSYRWDINRKLDRFFQNPTAFRSALGRVDGLITGSFALQFFANKFWPESDLDINVREGPGIETLASYLEGEGYELVRNQTIGTSPDYEEVFRMRHIRKVCILLKPRLVGSLVRWLRADNLKQILTFTKPRGSGDGSSPELKVQIITTMFHPVVVILGTFYTSCIVNFISWNKAYCIFPRATLLHNETVALVPPSDYNVPLHNKYSKRGWRLRTRPVEMASTIKNLPPRDVYPLGACLNADRRIGGRDTWTMKLNTTGVARPPQPDSVLEYSSFSVRVNSERLIDPWEGTSSERKSSLHHSLDESGDRRDKKKTALPDSSYTRIFLVFDLDLERYALTFVSGQATALLYVST